MRWQERGAIIIACLILVALPLSVVIYRYGPFAPPASAGTRVINLVARTPESGGWEPERITVNKGDHVRLRIRGTDVTHGFAIGRMNVETDWIVPGDLTEIEFTADTPGSFTFYCTTWCSPHHYRMRGTLEVLDPDGGDVSQPGETGMAMASPLPDIDIDADHDARFYPPEPPSADRGRRVLDAVGAHLLTSIDLNDLYATSPSDLLETTRASESVLAARMDGRALSDAEVWDLVAHLYARVSAPERIAQGEALYRKNCAACHGETGAGDGPGGEYTAEPVPDLTDARRVAGATSQIYAGKIRRGGMGTGMPYYGPILTDKEIQTLVDYLWTFFYELES